MELWDAYTADGRRTGETLVRGEPIPNGRYHLVCDVLVRHVDGSILCMKRSIRKPNFGGWYEATAGGSALRGEDPLTCVRRELREETGIDRGEFTLLKRLVLDDDRCIFFVYLCTVDWEKTAITLQDGETEGYCWMSEEEFGEFVRSGKMIPTQKKRFHDYLVSCGYVNE